MERDGNTHAEYWCGPCGDRAMLRQSACVDGQLELTLYGSAHYERRHISAAIEHIHTIQANGATVATVKRTGSGAKPLETRSGERWAVARAGSGIRQAMAAAALGGTASVIGGGKFANGAIAAAWVNLFNDQGRPLDLDHRVCNDRGVTCTSLGVQERLTLVDSAEALIREVDGTLSNTFDKLLNFESARRGAGFSFRARATVEAVTVDLFRIHMIEPVLVTVNGTRLGTFDGFNVPTARYVEVVNGSPYQRPATLREAMAPPRYPSRIDWAKLTGTPIRETDIQRRGW